MLNMFSLFMHSLHFVLILRERGTEREYNGFHYKNLFNIYNKRGFRLVLDRKSLFPETSHPVMAVGKGQFFHFKTALRKMVKNGQDIQMRDVPHFSIHPLVFSLESLTLFLYKSQSQEKEPFSHTDKINTDLPCNQQGQKEHHHIFFYSTTVLIITQEFTS